MANGTRRVLLNDLFTGGRQTRMITYVKTQARYNGAHNLNPNRIDFPNIDSFSVKINEAIIPPVIHNSQEAYWNLRQVLDRRNSEMPFTYDEYIQGYGIIVTDLSTNKDAYNQDLPNSASG